MCYENTMIWKKKLKILKILWNTLCKYGWYKQKTYERNGVETIVDNDGILWLNEKHIERLDDKKLQVTTINNVLGHRKLRYKLWDKPKKQPNRVFIGREMATKVSMDCRTTAAHKFRTRPGFKLYDIILNKEQSVLWKIKKLIYRRKHAHTVQCVRL